jgi:hypothetical protein
MSKALDLLFKPRSAAVIEASKSSYSPALIHEHMSFSKSLLPPELPVRTLNAFALTMCTMSM